MSTVIPAKALENRTLLVVSLVVTLLMGVLFTVLDVLQPAEWLFSLLAFIPGAISIVTLRAAGLSWDQLYLRPGRISRVGLGILAVTTLLLLPILGGSTSWQGWHWLPALVYAPASGIAQELYFRSSLLPAVERAFNGRKTLALLAHSLIFIGFHLRTFQAIGSLVPSLLVALVLFLAGCGWGWQVQRDRTVVWSMLQHSFFLILMSMFGWGQ
ncbi:MAG: CPBP family glutamic-type intramembrane protease [Anaerolineales bacterium]